MFPVGCYDIFDEGGVIALNFSLEIGHYSGDAPKIIASDSLILGP